jgi:hypothetical protein
MVDILCSVLYVKYRLRVFENGAEDDIWTEEGCGDGRMEKIA